MKWTDHDYDRFIAYVMSPGRPEPIARFAARLRQAHHLSAVTEDMVWGITSRFKETVLWWQSQSAAVQARIEDLCKRHGAPSAICKIMNAEGITPQWPLFLVKFVRHREHANLHRQSTAA